MNYQEKEVPGVYRRLQVWYPLARRITSAVQVIYLARRLNYLHDCTSPFILLLFVVYIRVLGKN